MADLYQYHRDKAIGNWMRNFALFMLMAYYAAAVAFTVSFYCYGGRPNHDGMTRDMWGVGLLIWLLCVAFTHGIFLTQIRDFNSHTVRWLGLIYVQWFIILLLVQFVVKSDPLYKAVAESFLDVHFWLVFFVAYALMMLPPIVYRSVQSLIVHTKFNFA
jgi:Phospholipid-translocating P-type ATPase C-terminal